jgi:hypothetical protein
MAIKPLVKPRFATSDLINGPLGGPNVQEPSELKKDSGWNSGEKPPREYFNWLHRLTYQWIDWLDEVASDALLKSNNLSDLSNTTTARTNLGLGTAAVTNTGTSAGNVPTITDADGRYARRSNNLSDLSNATTARTNLGLGTLALQNASSVNVTNFTASGNSSLAGASLGNTPIASPTVLDYYLEGSFTPSIIGTAPAGGATYSIQEGRYTRIGNRVFYSIRLDWSAHTGGGFFSITGLPFTANSANVNYPASIYWSGVPIGSGYVPNAIIIGGVNFITLGAYDPTTGGIASVPVDTSGTVFIDGSYQV